jgi:hypothetical protein
MGTGFDKMRVTFMFFGSITVRKDTGRHLRLLARFFGVRKRIGACPVACRDKGWGYQQAVVLGGVLAMIASSVVFPARAHAGDDPLKIHTTRVKEIEVRQKIQKNEDQWAENKVELVARYQALKSEEKGLQKAKAIFEKQVRARQSQRSEIKRQMTETDRIRDTLQSRLDEVMIRLAESIGRDLPFLLRERSDRIDVVNEILAQPDASFAEKYRRVMEVLKIETEYGQSVEVYQQAISIDGKTDHPTVVVDILRVGRLALFFRTPDGQMVGNWDLASANWTVLDKKYRRHINDAMEMALRRRTVEMVKLPLGRIAPQ